MDTQRRLERSHQVHLLKRFGQECHGAGIKRSLPDMRFRISRYKDDWRPISVRPQLRLQLSAAQARQLLVGDKAPGAVNVARIQKLLRRYETERCISQRVEQIGGCISDDGIIVDDTYQDRNHAQRFRGRCDWAQRIQDSKIIR